MKRKGFLVLWGIVCVVLVLTVIPFMAACATPAPAPAPKPTPTPTPAPAPKPEPIVLKIVTKDSTTHDTVKGFLMYADMVKEASKGELTIEWAGGKEVIPNRMLTEAVRTGAIEMAMPVTAYYADLMPVGHAFALSELSPLEERESGFHDFVVERHKELNMFYLGRVRTNSPFFLWSNVKVETPYDLAGLKFRSSGLYRAFFKDLGLVGVSMPLGDVYAAMDRGLVDGWACSPASAWSRGLYEVTEYRITPGFLGANNVTVLVNLDTWNGLPKHLQDLMIQTMIDIEPMLADYYTDVLQETLQKVTDGGVKPIEFSAADAKWYLDTIYRAKWEEARENLSPELYTKVREMITK